MTSTATAPAAQMTRMTATLPTAAEIRLLGDPGTAYGITEDRARAVAVEVARFVGHDLAAEIMVAGPGFHAPNWTIVCEGTGLDCWPHEFGEFVQFSPKALAKTKAVTAGLLLEAQSSWCLNLFVIED